MSEEPSLDKESIQYVYNYQLLDVNDATTINQSIQSIWQKIGFEDPFAGTPKHAKVMKLNLMKK